MTAEITLEIDDAAQQEMNALLLEFGERHDLSLAELVYYVVTSLTYHGYVIGKEQNVN